MITSDKKLKVTKDRIEDLRASLKTPANQDIKEFLQTAARIQTEVLIKELEAQVEEFKSLNTKV